MSTTSVSRTGACVRLKRRRHASCIMQLDASACATDACRGTDCSLSLSLVYSSSSPGDALPRLALQLIMQPQLHMHSRIYNSTQYTRIYRRYKNIQS